MEEIIIDYSSSEKRSWLTCKLQGLVNRYCKARRILLWKLYVLRKRPQIDQRFIIPGSIPVLINNYNRLSVLKEQISWLRSLNENISIIIVDNHSNYRPLLDYYQSLDYPNTQVVYLKINSWLNGMCYLSKRIRGVDKMILTDSDLLPYHDTPHNLVAHLSDLLDRYPEYNHIGVSLEINDLPDHYPLKQQVIQHEQRYWWPVSQKLNNEVYVAPIDSTFAMYRKTSNVFAKYPALRCDRPYTLKHIDWYQNPADFSEEIAQYYEQSKTFATWAAEWKRVNRKTGTRTLTGSRN